LLAEIDGTNAALYLLTDALGSVRGLTDGTGALTGTSSFDAFGTVRSSTGVTSRFGFTGEQLDSETGYTFLRARYLNTKHGRFISRDTVQPNADGSQGYNRYAYVANNPCTLTDPSGHEADCQSTLGAISWLALINVAVRGLLIGVSPVDKSGFAIFTYAALGAATIGFAEAFGNGLGWAEDIAASKGGRLGFAVFHLLAGEAGGVALLSFGIAFVAWGRSLLAAPVGLALIVAATLLFLTAISMEAMLAISNIRSRVIDKFCGSAGSVFSAFSSLGGFLGGESYGPGGRNSAFQGGSDSPASLYNVADTVPASPKIARPNAV
jgi:RHS repeat-associated protein